MGERCGDKKTGISVFQALFRPRILDFWFSLNLCRRLFGFLSCNQLANHL